MTISEKIAHLMGLAEGLELDTEKSKEGRLIAEMMDIIRDMSDKLSQLEDNVDLVNEELDELSDEVMAFEEDYYLEEEDFDEDEDYDYEDDEDDEDDEDPIYLVTCPVCGEEMELDEDSILSGEIRCQDCGQLFTLEIVDMDEADEIQPVEEDSSEPED